MLSHTVVSNSLPPGGLQHTRLPCPSLSSGVCSNSCLLMPPNLLIFCCPLLLLPLIFPSIRVFFFSNESALCTKWVKYWRFRISPLNEYSVLISFRNDWFDRLAVQCTLKSLQNHDSKASIFQHIVLDNSLFFCFVVFKKQGRDWFCIRDLWIY